MAIRSRKRAKSTPGGATSSRRVDDDGRWTVMVFMGATTFEGNVPLDAAADADIAEMEAIGSAPGRLDIFVERHDDRGVRRYHIGRPEKSEFPRVTKRTSDGQDLRRFVFDSLRAAGHRYKDHAMLVLWGHAYDFAFGRRRETDGTVDALDFAEIGDLLGAIQADMKRLYEAAGSIGRNELPTLDIIAFDACELSTVEMACQLHPYAQYLLGSEIGIPIPGWPYDRILDRVANPVGTPMGAAEFGSYVVRRYCESYTAAQDAVSLTLLDLAYTAELTDRTAWLAQRLAIAIRDPPMLNRIADLFSLSQTEKGRPYVDVADLCVNLARDSGHAAIIAAATALGDFMVSPRPAVVRLSHTGEGRALVVEHGRNAGSLARLNGISLYAPHVVPGRKVAAARQLYDKFAFAQETLWNDLVHTLVRS